MLGLEQNEELEIKLRWLASKGFALNTKRQEILFINGTSKNSLLSMKTNSVMHADK